MFQEEVLTAGANVRGVWILVPPSPRALGLRLNETNGPVEPGFSIATFRSSSLLKKIPSTGTNIKKTTKPIYIQICAPMERRMENAYWN